MEGVGADLGVPRWAVEGQVEGSQVRGRSQWGDMGDGGSYQPEQDTGVVAGPGAVSQGLAGSFPSSHAAVLWRGQAKHTLTSISQMRP